MGTAADTRWLLLVAITLYILCINPCSSAPSPYGKLRSPREKGCYYLLKHYQNGQQIETNEPCLNCSCVNSMLMCYLRVCPYVRPIGDKCIIEKVPGECCPRITCPDVPPDPEPEPEAHEPTTPEPEEAEGAGCYVDDKHFREGAQMPSDLGKPCEICYCIRNTSACVSQECSLGVPGCQPTYSSNSCCPTRYNCSAEAATTVPPELRHPSVPELGCRANGRTYVDGEAVPSKDPCEHCYCMKHEVVCAVQECKAPCEGCVPIPSPNDRCCPERYECPAPKRPVPHRDIHSDEAHVTTAITPTIAINKDLESTSESSPGGVQSSTVASPASPPVTTGEPELSSATADSSTLHPSTTSKADLTSTTGLPTTTSPPEPSSAQTSPPESSGSSEAPASEATGSTQASSAAGSSLTTDTTETTQLEDREKMTAVTPITAIPIGGDHIKAGPREEESGSTTGSPKIDSKIPEEVTSAPQDIPVSGGENVASDITTTTPGSESDRMEITTESPVITVPVENMIMPASQPRRDEAGDRISTRRPGTQRKTFPSIGVIPGEGICRYEGKVYQNGDEVASHNPCVEFCMCINSVVYCDETVCEDVRPIEGQNCTKVKGKTDCCPRLECQPLTTTTASTTTTTTTLAPTETTSVLATTSSTQTTAQSTRDDSTTSAGMTSSTDSSSKITSFTESVTANPTTLSTQKATDTSASTDAEYTTAQNSASTQLVLSTTEAVRISGESTESPSLPTTPAIAIAVGSESPETTTGSSSSTTASTSQSIPPADEKSENQITTAYPVSDSTETHSEGSQSLATTAEPDVTSPTDLRSSTVSTGSSSESEPSSTADPEVTTSILSSSPISASSPDSVASEDLPTTAASSSPPAEEATSTVLPVHVSENVSIPSEMRLSTESPLQEPSTSSLEWATTQTEHLVTAVPQSTSTLSSTSTVTVEDAASPDSAAPQEGTEKPASVVSESISRTESEPESSSASPAPTSTASVADPSSSTSESTTAYSLLITESSSTAHSVRVWEESTERPSRPSSTESPATATSIQSSSSASPVTDESTAPAFTITSVHPGVSSTVQPAKEEIEEEHDDTTCLYEGKAYQSAEQIPRSHPCDFCFCFRGDIICLQQTCPPPIPGCNETPIRGFCCPRYECPVSSSSNATTPRSVGETRGCNVEGRFYEIGDKIKTRASSPCLECVCDHSGMVRCNPQDCSPQAPLLLRMNREFAKAWRRRR